MLWLVASCGDPELPRLADAAPESDGPVPTTRMPNLVALTANNMAPLAGETITITVTLDRPAPPEGLSIAVDVTSSAMVTPVQVVVPAAKSSWQFDAYAELPTSRFVLRARTDGSSKELNLRIAGLEIAEVLADPVGADDGLQWIKIHNRARVPIDLRRYELRAGESSYANTTLPLLGSLRVGGCAVIGGPNSGSANGTPSYSMAADFSPDLPHGRIQAAGYALFDKTASGGPGASPVDTMIVGPANTGELLDPNGDVPNPYCAAPVAGASALRTGPTTCVQATMQPDSCQ